MYKFGLPSCATRDKVYNFCTLTLCPVRAPQRCTKLGSILLRYMMGICTHALPGKHTTEMYKAGLSSCTIRDKVYNFCTLTLYPVRAPQRCTKLGSILLRYVTGILYVLRLYSQFSFKKNNHPTRGNFAVVMADS